MMNCKVNIRKADVIENVIPSDARNLSVSPNTDLLRHLAMRLPRTLRVLAMTRSSVIPLMLLSVLFFSRPFAFADDTIKILMLDSPRNPLPSQEAEKVESLKGKVFFNGLSYSGSFEIMKDKNGLYVINSLPFEKYIEGVVASEVGKDWETEALKAQAVISRTYAVFNKDLNEEKYFHLTSSVLHQAYKGENMDPFIAQAVEATRGEILTYEEKPANALYHATCEGKTELPEEVWAESFPYLKSVECNGKNTPYESWRRHFTFEEMNRTLGINGFKDIMVTSYTVTGRVKTLRLIFDDTGAGMEIRATELRKLLGYKELPSTDFTISKTDKEIILEGKGYGHGVGLSQWGALTMAREGKNYREILAHYYPGTTIKKDYKNLHSLNVIPASEDSRK